MSTHKKKIIPTIAQKNGINVNLLVGGWTTHLKNMLVKMGIFPNFRSENSKKIFELPPPRIRKTRLHGNPWPNPNLDLYVPLKKKTHARPPSSKRKSGPYHHRPTSNGQWHVTGESKIKPCNHRGLWGALQPTMFCQKNPHENHQHDTTRRVLNQK